MLTSTKKRLTIGAIVLGIAALGYVGYRFSETGDLFAAVGMGYESYTCADVLNSSEKSAEVEEAFNREYASILGKDPEMIRGAWAVDGQCRSAKPDDNAWEAVQPYLYQLERFRK